MTPAGLLNALRAAGFTVAQSDDRLTVGPKERLTDEWRESIKEHKAGLLALLEEEAEAEAMRPFRGAPPPDDPAWVPAGEYSAFWTALEAWNAQLPAWQEKRRAVIFTTERPSMPPKEATPRPRRKRPGKAGAAPPVVPPGPSSAPAAPGPSATAG